MPQTVHTVDWVAGAVRLIDQTRLPAELVYLDCRDIETLAEAIEVLRVRGAPAIGVAAGFGLALAASHSTAATVSQLQAELRATHERLARTRPTAVNLFWALDRQRRVAAAGAPTVAELRAGLLAEARAIQAEDLAANEALSRHGAELLPAGARVLTHCNAGALATGGGYGTALGVIRAAAEQGKIERVYADETRPLLQGARLTAWEMVSDGIPVTVLTDSMAAWLMRERRVDCVITGADRIAANGDVANKIGTYGVAVQAHHHGLPFYVAAPTSTLDLSLADGSEIPIEQRRPEEISRWGDRLTVPDGAEVYNPAFDVTPHELVAAIITERGVVREPYGAGLQAQLA